MSEETAHLVQSIIGAFVLVMFLASYFYGWYPIIVMVIGLFLCGLLTNASANHAKQADKKQRNERD